MEKELTKKDLLAIALPDSVSNIIWRICHKMLHEVPKELLTDDVLNQQDSEFRSGYHLAALYGQFDHIPKELITPEILKESGEAGQKTWAILLKSGRINTLLPFLDDIIDDCETEGQSFLHVCATLNNIKEIPTQYITKLRLLRNRNYSTDNVIHFAAYHGCLDQIPDKFLTEETMWIPNFIRQTPIDLATSSGKIGLIPKKFLTERVLITEGYDGTAFHTAAINCKLDTFPKEFLTEKNLIRKSTKNGQSPLYILGKHCDVHKDNPASSQFSKLIKILSDKNLQSLAKELDDDDIPIALKIAKKELLKRKILQTIKETNELDIYV